jgi:signal peptidase II
VQKRRVVVAAVAPPTPLRRRFLLVAVAVIVVAVDQSTKTWAEHQRVPRHLLGPLWLWFSVNSGAAFSLGRGSSVIIETIAVVIVVLLVLFSRRASRTGGRLLMVSLGLLVGGAVGNLIDRVLRHNGGGVVDFIDVARIGHRDLWPVFNVADACIVAGVIGLVLSYGRLSRQAAVT